MPTSSHVLPWIDQALKAKRRPTCEEIVAEGRRQQPRPKSWAALAREISNLAGRDVSGETLRNQFGHLDDTTDGAA